MTSSLQIIAFLSCLLLTLSITGVGLNPIRPLQLNKGLSTRYMFYINPQTSIAAGAQVQITFPSEFDRTAIAARLSCLASTPSYTWRSVPCTFTAGSVVITLGSIRNEQLNILVSQPTNPTIFSMSSFFSVCLMVASMTTSCSQTFGKVVFPDAPVTTASTPSFPSITSLNTLVVGQSSTYQIQFSLSTTYSAGNTIRITFPAGFLTSSTPICQMAGTYNQVITTFVWPDQRSIECQNINKTLSAGESLKIIGIFNPQFAGTFGNTNDGFKLQILQQTTTIVLQQIFIQNTVAIAAGTLTGYISQANNFINGDVVYTFYLNLLNSLSSNNFILISFDNTWLLYNGQCSVISGITLRPNTRLNCTNNTLTPGRTVLNVSNFLSASVSNQLVFSITVRSPATPGTYNVGIRTANINGTVDSMSTTVFLNGTHGDYSMLSINAITAQSDVPVSGTGPLELTFFLNYELPQTNVLTFGKFEVKIFPQIPLPPPLVNGVLKCYFFNTIPAQTCIWNTAASPLYTLLTINTPLTMAYQYSQIPITITTEGAVSTSKIGITIADIVTRYRFQLAAYQHNNSVIPTEVYFSEYIAAPISFPITYYSLSKEVNEYTHLRFEFASPYNFTTPLVNDLRIKIEFLANGAWAPNLGYEPNTIYKNFPCVFSDNKLQLLPPQYNSKVTCDLYTYLTGPHASLTNPNSRGPYILVSGFTNLMLINSQVRLELGRFLIGSSTNLAANIRFSLVQETPTMLTKFVQLYFNEFTAFTTAPQSIATAGTGVLTDSIANSRINTVSIHSVTYTAPSTFFAIIYEFDQISTPSFDNQFIQCNNGAGVQNWCTMLGYPVNYIVEYHYSGTFPIAVSSRLNFTNGVYAGTFTATARLFSSASLTIYKQRFNVVYTPYTITSFSFYMDTATSSTLGRLYKGAQTYFEIYHVPIFNTPDNGFVRFIFSNGIQLGQNPFCTSSDFAPFVAEVGLVCTIESPTSLRLSNIVGLTAGIGYTLRVRLATQLATGTSVNPQVTIQDHYSVTADPSIVNQVNTISLSPGRTNQNTIPNQFKINNPRTAFETPRTRYVGKFQFSFNPSNDVLVAFQIRVILNNHAWNGGVWTTPNAVATDPLVCMINYIRVPCTYTLSPLTVTMNVSPAGLVSSQDNIITLDTEYLSPTNGIVHPSQAGQYNLFLQFLTNTSTIIQQQSFYHRVLPPRLGNYYVNSTVNDVGVENMFYVQFETPIGDTVNANNHGSTYSRIFIEFPTVDSNGNPLFASNLGGYTQSGQIVGCAFDTWTNYYVGSATSRLMCRLIMSEVPGDPVQVEIINHGSFSGSYRFMRLWIAKVFNPAVAVTSVPISIRINHVVVSTNDIYQLYYDTFDVFMNSQNPNPGVHPSENCQAGYGCSGSCSIFSGNRINNRNWFRFAPNNIGASYSAATGFYYALDTTSVIRPRSLQNEVGNNNCHGSYYHACWAFPDINYFIIWAKAYYIVQMYFDTGNAISQYNTNLVAKVWANQRYIGTHTIVLSPSCWNQLIGYYNSMSIAPTSTNSWDLYLGKRKTEVVVTFTTGFFLPATGSILINWPSSIPRIYPHCRSMTNLGSQLYAQGAGSTFDGEIGCLVQNTRQWYITGFNALSAGSTVRIVGKIDLPTSQSGWIGAGEVITFNNTHPTDIRTNGFIIDYYYSGSFGLNINNAPSQNVQGQLLFEETLPLRVNYVGPLRFKFSLASNLNGPNAGVIAVRIPGLSTIGQSGGFGYVSSKKHVCQIMQISTYQETGCIIQSIIPDSNASNPSYASYLFTMTTSSALTSGVVYRLVITTHTGTQPEGLTFPTVPGTYKVDFNFDTTGSTGQSIHNHLYLEVYGTKFALLQATAFCTCPANKNIIWLRLTPTTTILTTQQLIIQVPTVAANGNLLFADDLGTGVADGASIPYDTMNNVFSQTFMTCRLFHGDRANSKPGRIVCGQFTSTITSSQILWFAISLGNPSSFTGNQVSIPFFVYSQEQGTTYRTNFDVIQNAVFLRRDVNTVSDGGWTYTQNQQLQTSGMFLQTITRNPWNIGAGDYYLLLFNFPLRVNGLVSGGCTYQGSTTYGDAYYHQNLWVIVCAVTSATIGVPAGGWTTRNLRISGFYSPFYFLSASERTLTTYSYYFSSKITTIGYITDGYPNEGPKISGSPSLTLTPIHQTGTMYAGSRDDYTITFTYNTVGSTIDLSFTQLIAFIFPTSIDYAFPEADCVQSPSSQVQIASCYIDTAQGVIWITPVVKSSYTSNMAVSITTRNLAIRNPVSNINLNNNAFVVKYYSWQNISQPGLAPLSNNNYCFLLINNFPSVAINYAQNPSGYQVPTFTYLKYPHQRYYQDVPFSSLVHRAPFEMEFVPAVAFNVQSGSNFNMIKIEYPMSFTDNAMIKIRDLQVFRPVCYLNNYRIKNCVIDTIAHTMTMSFQFDLAANTKYHLKFSILDSRNADIDGFLASTAVSNIVLMYRPYGAANWYYTETDQFPTLYSLPTGAAAGPFRTIVAGTPTYGHAVASRLNFVNLQLTFNRTDITGLVFEIPSVDKAGTALFGSSAQLTATFMGQSNGGSYPCGNNGLSAGGSVRCILLTGDFSSTGVATRIIMTGFTYQTQMNCRFVFVNPPTVNAYFSVIVRAFGGTVSSLNPYGNQYMGVWQFNQIFQIVSGSVDTNTYNANSYRCPSQSPWRNTTTVYVFSRNQVIGSGRSSIAAVKIFDSSSSMTDKSFCQPTLDPSNSNADMLQYTLVSGGVTTRFAYFIRTWTANTDVSIGSNGWGLDYLKCKYYTGVSFIANFFFGDGDIQIATNNFPTSNCNGYTSFSSPISKYFSQSNFVADGTDTSLVHEIDITPTLTTMTNFNFRNGDAMVLSITYGDNPWGTLSSCELLGGISSTSVNQRAFCLVGSNTVVYIVNVGGFVTDPLLATNTNYRVKFRLFSTGLVTTANNNNFYFYMRLFANLDAYVNSYHPIFYEYNSVITASSSLCYHNYPGSCDISQSSGTLGTFQVQSLSDTFMRAAFSPSSTINFGGGTSFTHTFEITFNGFNFGSSCSISNVVFQYSTSATPGSGTNNSVPINSATCDIRHIELSFSGRAFANYWGGVGASSGGSYTAGQFIIFYITISPDPTGRDLPTYHHDYLFIQGAYSYYSGGWQIRVQNTVTMPALPLASSATLSTLSSNVNGVTEFSITITSASISFGPQNNGYWLLAEFLGSSGWTGSNDPFASYTNTALLADSIACKCISGASPLTVSLASAIVDATCVRRLPNSTFFTNYAILINANVQQNQDLRCFFPEFRIAASSSVQVEFKLIDGDVYPPDLVGTTTKYNSLYRVSSNTLSFGTTPTMSLTGFSTLTETPNFYATATNVGSSFSGAYSLFGSWSAGLNSPNLYINFLSAGPIPVNNFCSDSNVFLQCRVYTNLVYVVVAQLKSTSASSFNLSNSGATLLYPPSQTSLSNYGANIYVGVNNWQYSTSISRSMSSLTPISTAGIFNVYSDRYGSTKTGYSTNLFFSFNPSGQSLFNNVATGSQLVISWSGITTTTNCQVWVQGEPLVRLNCATASNSLVITSPFWDYSTTNNIIASIGLTNPSSATTFFANLYSYYYSATRFSLTISIQRTYTPDSSYASFIPVSKATVSMYPFLARMSTVANAPMRIRFVLPSSSVASASGRLVFTYSQIQYSSAHLCFIIAYASYTAMMQQTQRTVYRTGSCTSSGSTLTVVPPAPLTLVPSVYYELVIMPLNINAAGCAAHGCVTQSGYQQLNFDPVTFVAQNNWAAPSIISQQVNRVYNYEGSSFIGLQQIYVLCTQPTITSIYLSININFTSSNNFPTHYLEITFFDLKITAFPGYSIGDIIPCQLSSNFLSINARQPPQCRVVSADNINTFVTVRIENFGFLSPQTYWVTLDDIVLPTPTPAVNNNNKFDIAITYQGPSNLRYSNYFPEIFQIDNTNLTAPVTNTVFTFNNPAVTGFGAPITGQVTFNWPFDTTSSGYESKIAINFNGGYSAIWSNINAVTFVDAFGTYQLLWVNTKLNKFVFLIPNKGNGISTTLNITSLNNPYPYQRSLYNFNSTNIIINFYNNHFLANRQTFGQPAFNIFTMNPALIYINQNYPCNTMDYFSGNSYAPNSQNVLLLSISFDQNATNIQARNLGNIEIRFTSGISYIRECRAMRNNTQFINTVQVCQPYFDGTSWYVRLYDVANSQLSTGWWVQIFATFNSATHTYTSSVMASNNMVVEYQTTYTMTMPGYNASRTIPTRLSWLNNKYVANFHETQYKFLEAVTGQSTQYIKFRWSPPITSSIYSDIFQIYLPSNAASQPFTPKTSGSNVIAQFLPSMGPGDWDFSVGFFSECTLTNQGSYFYYRCHMRYGGLTAGHDYLVQLSEFNTATSSFWMPTSPGRQQISFMYQYYPSYYDWRYYEQTIVYYYRFFRSAEFLHTTTTVSDYQTITINYRPYGSLSAFASNNEIALRLSVETRYHAADGGITAVYTADNMVLDSGDQFSGVVSNPNGGEINTIQFGQYSIELTPLRFVLAKQSAYSDNTLYTWIVPLLQNPSTAFVSLRYNLTLVTSPASSYEYIFNHYQSINEYFTMSSSSASFVTSITNNLRAVQTVGAVDLSINLGNYSLNQWNTAIFKINNALPGLIQAISSPNDTSNYNYYYFGLINMVMAQKKSLNTITTIGIGSASSVINYQSTFGISWVRVFNTSNVPINYNPSSLLFSTPPILTLTHLTSYSASSVTLVEGYQTQGSTAMYRVTFTTPIVPQSGEIRILFDRNFFTSNNNALCRVHTNFARSATATEILRCYRVSEGFRIAGYNAISAGVSVSAYIMLKSTAAATASPIQVDIFGKYQDNTTRIALANVGTVTHTASTSPSSIFRIEQTVIPYWASIRSSARYYYMIEGTFNLRLTTLLNGDYLYLQEDSKLAASGGNRRFLIKQNTTSVTGWTELFGYYTNPEYRYTLPTNYLVTQSATTNVQYIFRLFYYNNNPNGFYFDGTGNYRFWLFTDKSNGARQQVGYYDFVPYPNPKVLTIKNRYTAAGRQTVLDLSWSSDVDIGPGNTLTVSFDTSNRLSQMFANDLEGVGTGGATYRYLDCRQWNTMSEISTNRIVCLLNFGNSLANPPVPANLTIKFSTTSYGWSTSNNIRILIANVMNPTTVGLNTGVTVNVFTPCENQQNQPCSLYTARGYYVTTSGSENALSTSTSFTSSSNLVLATGLTHTFTLPLTSSLTVDDAIYIIYPENFQGLMPSNCAVTNYLCYVFPSRRWVVLFPTNLISATPTISLAITSMNNPYYSQPFSQFFLVTVARSSQGLIGETYRILQNPFTPVSYSFPYPATPTAISVVPTQTPSMYLRNYANTVIFTISNLFSDSRIKAIYIRAPSDVTSWDPTYCNASLTTTTNFNYPLRFTCIVDPLTPLFLRLTLDSDMKTYDPSWALLNIRVHAKFTLADFPTPPTLYVTTPVTSGSFFAYSSVNATSSSSLYYMSQCSLTISISQNQVPIISVINFNTQSFADRVAKVNNKEVFYLLFKPLVNVNIGSVVFTIPSQFNYPGVFQFDNCLMIGRTTVGQSNCQLSRSQGQTLVTLVPNNYDNQVKIIQLGTVSQSNWFTAPSLPGDFYNMNVAIYSTTGTLIAKQTRNISPVYGQSFNIPSMTIQNIQDADSKFAVYDLSFVTGTLQIPPGTLTTATTQTSELQFIFENFNGMNPTNVFANDLKTGLSNGDQIGCKFFSGLTAVPGTRLKCLLSVGTNATNKPKIRVINYNFINPGTTIIIGFAGIQSLPSTLVNTISIGVVIYYTDIGSSTYLYIPTPIITVPTNSSTMLSSFSGWNWQVNASYSGTNIVLQPTTFTISFIIGALARYNNLGNFIGYYTYSSTGANDQFILLTFYPPTLLDKNNPTPVTCPSCTSVDVYYASGTVRFRHSTVNYYYNGPRAFQFNNFPTSAYSMLSQTVYVFMQVIQSYQTIFQRNITVNLSRTVEKCTRFNFGVVSVSSLNGGEIGVTYLFSIKTNHYVPADGALSITIPPVYGNLISNMATCTLIGFANTNCYCSILTPYRVDIYANGTELSPGTTYSVQITGMQNPNVQSSSFVFIVTSYYASNIYLGLKICENQIVPPAINVKPLRTCTLSWTPEYYNQNFNSSYVFQMSCSDVFRGDSVLYINLPSAYSSGNRLGRYSCTSYESTTLVSPVCTLQNINGVFTLTTSIDASSQSSLSLIINLVNPINNTYVASAYVTSKGTQYASSGNSSITILSNSYARAQSSDVSLLNLPKEAGLMSTYVFKISPISSFAPSNLGITFPHNFYVDSTKITVSILNSARNNLFSLLTYNNIQSLISNASSIAGSRVSSYPTFKIFGTSVQLLNINGQVSPSLWTYVFISNIQNPSAYVFANFTVAYYLISNGFQALQWAFQNPLTYYISSPPQFISINSVTVSDYDLLFPANYTFNISSAGPAIGIAGKNISYIIVVPTFYRNTLWANSPPVCKFSVLNTTSSCYSYQSQIIVTEVFTVNYTSLSLTISTLLNPSLPTSCNTTDRSILAQTFFIVRIIDTVSSSFLFESSSVVDSTNCLTFSAIRIPISVEYSLIMTAGLAYNITYGLTKPSSNLKISAFISNSGFTFSPAIVDFNDFYTLTKSTQLFLRSDVSPGTYVIYFNKSESSNQTFFRNILPVTITVSSSNASSSSFVTAPTISIPSMSDSTIGYPVTIPVQFSLPSSTEMILFMSISEESNQTLAQYSSAFANFNITPRVFTILPQETQYKYTISLASQFVPPPLTLNFRLTSNYPIVHKLLTPTMYLCFDRDPRFNVLYPPLRVTLTQFLSSCNRQDEGRQVTNILVSNQSSQSSAGSVTPKIISMSVSSVASTGAVITINSISAGTIFYACISAGYPAITNASLLISLNNSQGVAGYASSQSLDVNTGRTAQINFVATATISGLNQSSNYVFYALSRSNLGTSSIAALNFTTAPISRGVQFRISFTTVVTNLQLVNALVQSLRVSPGRIKILTNIVTLQKQANLSQQASNNRPRFAYDIVLAPDEANDIISPWTTIQNFAKNSTALSNFQRSIASFDIATPITYFQLRPIQPQMSAAPQTVQINNYNATFSVWFKTQSNVYAILMESVGTANSSLSALSQINPVAVGSLNATQRSMAPSSSQIKAGTDFKNNHLGKYKVVQITTDENGRGTLTFSDLKEKSSYTVYITASSPLPYQPTMLWPDDKVVTFTFYTLPNPNVGDSTKQKVYVQQLFQINPKMAAQIKKSIEAYEKKKKADNK